MRSLFAAGLLAALATSAFADGPRNWGYQLSDIDPAVIARSEYELVVIDHTATGDDPFSADEVAGMKTRPDGGRRTVISYFSIGEAEDYRFYWREAWRTDPPPWMERENPDWEGNYKVNYWDPGWRAILYGSEGAFLDRILAAGFDGVYLDIVDAFEYFEAVRPTAEAEMAQLILDLAAYARARDPDFLFITQNGERILANDSVLAAIDGAAKEDLFYGLERDDLAAPASETEFSLQFLTRARDAGKFVLLASYVPHAEGQSRVMAEAARLHFPVYFGDRELDALRRDGGAGGVYYAPPPPREASGETALAETRYTPGDFYLNTLRKGRFKATVTAEYFVEESVFEERDRNGVVTFRELDEFEENALRFELLYGLTDRLEVGFSVPAVRAELDFQEVIGGRRSGSIRDTGAGNLTLLANYSLPLDVENDVFSLASLELGLPTDTRRNDLKSEGTVDLRYEAETFWDRFGLRAGVGLHYAGRDGFDDGETEVSFSIGGLVALSDEVFIDAGYVHRGGDSFIEGNLEFLLSERASIGVFFEADLESRFESRAAGLYLSVLSPSR